VNKDYVAIFYIAELLVTVFLGTIKMKLIYKDYLTAT